MSEEKKQAPEPMSQSDIRPSTDGRTAGEVWIAEAQIVEVTDETAL